MLAHVLAPAMARRGVHYGWIVVAVAFLTMLATAAAMGMPGVLLLPLKGEFGWDLGAISGALALRLALFGMVAPFAAALMLRYGMRVVVSTALVFIVAGLALATQMTALWQLWLTWGLMLGLSTGVTANVLGATVASRWFTKRRGLVVGLLSASSATGQLLFLPVRRAGGNALALSFSALAMASRNRTFWILAGTFFVCGLSTNGLVQNHFIPLCHDFGMDAVSASGVLALMGACDFVGTIVSGWLSDRYDNRWLLSWYYGLRGLSLLVLPYSDFSFFGLSLFAVFYGLDWIATVPPTVKLAGQTFGREQGPLVFGWVFTAHQLGAATAAVGAGATRDMLMSYLPAFAFAGMACLLAAIAVLTVRKRPAAPVGIAAAD